MRHSIFSFLSVALLVLTQALVAQNRPARLDMDEPSSPWFDHIKKPLKISPEEGIKLTVSLRKGLLDNTPVEALLPLCPNDGNYRVFFATLSDGRWPSRTYYGAGATSRDAFKVLINTIRKRESFYGENLTKRLQDEIEARKKDGKPVPDAWKKKLENPLEWTSLKLDIVQSARVIPDYRVSTSKVLLTSQIGLAFDPIPGFAFTPEELTGHFLMTPNHLLSEHSVGEMISEDGMFEAMKAWMLIVSANQTQRLRLFESDTYYADETVQCRMFRGHPIVNPDTVAPLEQARRTARQLADCLDTKGTFTPPFAEWVESRRNGGESPVSLAMLALALARVSVATGDKSFAKSAETLLTPIINQIKTYSNDQAAYFSEEEELAEDNQYQRPRQFIHARTNAMIVLALLELDKANGITKVNDKAFKLLCHLARCQNGDGSFLPTLVLPEMKKPLEDFFTQEGKLDSYAIAALAFAEYAGTDKKNEAECRKRASLAAKHILSTAIEGRAVQQFPTSPWLPMCFSKLHFESQADIIQLAKLSLAASMRSNTSPLLPDSFGSNDEIPSTAIAAEQLLSIISVSELLKSHGQDSDAREFLADAWPAWCFLCQAYLDKPTASALPHPSEYLDFARDNLEDFSFELDGHIMHLLALVAVDEVLKSYKLEHFPCSESIKNDYKKAWTALDNNPKFLDPVLVINNAVEGDNRRLIGTFGNETTTTKQLKSGKIVGAEHEFTSRLVNRKKK